MENIEVNNKHKEIWEYQDYFIRLVFQAQDITIWKIIKTQI